MRIQSLDLSTGTITTIFQATGGAWIYFVTVSPDEKQLVMAYTPPTANNANSQQALYIMPTDGSKPPQLLFLPASPDDEYLQPAFSPDGKYLYFTHVNFSAPPKMQGEHYPIYEVYRMAFPDGQPEKLVDQAFWPRLSWDGSRLAYVTVNPVDGTNQLYVANPDGTNSTQINLTAGGSPQIIDAPAFSPDNQSLLYSAVDPTTQSAQPNWWERLLGIGIVSAHTVPSDWWSVPLAGGAPTQLTHIAALGLFASVSPDKQYLASYSGSGLFVMKPDGSQLSVLVSDLGGVPGTVNWLP